MYSRGRFYQGSRMGLLADLFDKLRSTQVRAYDDRA